MNLTRLNGLGDFPVSYEDWKKKAQAKLSPDQFAFVFAGAGDGDVMEENERALGRWRLIPRVLRSLSDLSISTEILGIKVGAPIMLAPVRGLDYIRPRGQELSAQAAAKCETPLIISNLASSSLEDIATILGRTPRFLQLYPCTDFELVQSLLNRSEKVGYSGVVLTVDMTGHSIQYRGPQSSEYQNFGNEMYFSDPVFQSRLKQPVEKDKKAALELVRKLREGSFTWEDVDKIREATRLPIVLKGVLSPDDANEAMRRGVAGLVVSNHGGRTLSGEVASIDMLPGIVEAVGTKLSVMYDGGIRSGTDVLKALALGANAVLIGRAYVYALAYGGAEGVLFLLTTIMREVKNGLASSGCSSVKELNSSFIRHIS